MNNEIVRQATSGQIKDIAMALMSAMPGDLTFDEAQKIIEKKGLLVSATKTVFSAYRRTIEIGKPFKLEIGGWTKKELLERLKSTPVKIWATRMIEREEFTLLPEKTNVTLIIKTVGDLGFEDREAWFERILDAGKRQDLKLCPPETGARLWLAQEKLGVPDGFYMMAMDTFLDANDAPSAFGLGIYNELKETDKGFFGWLQGGDGLKAKVEKKRMYIFRCD